MSTIDIVGQYLFINIGKETQDMRPKIIQPLWYHPTTVMLVDDEPKLLKSLEMKIHKNFVPITFTDPKKALEYLKKNILPLEELSQSMISDIDPSEEKHLSTENLAVDFSPLHAGLNKPTRFTRIVDIVVDRAMDEMDGLDFCREVRKLGFPVNLILLTGHTTLSEAVAALNDNVINAYVEKSPDFTAIADQVNPYIRKLAHQAFCDMSAQLLGLLSNRFSFLTRQAYADFLKTICQKYNIIEYMIIDSSGSCLLITTEGEVKVLLMKTANDFKDAYDIAMSDGSANVDVLEALKSQRAFPFTGTEHSHFNFDASRWKGAMVPMKKQEDLNLYYGITDVSKKVMSFNDYAKEA